MGRPRGAPTTRKEFRLEARQVQYLEALIATASLGKPTLVSLIRQAVDDLISRELAKPAVKSGVEIFMKRHGSVVNLHEVANRK
jgi:hypothetical protein